jgi:alkanesulfonate monooxygenase
MNLINGRDNIMETYGVTTSHDDRYVLGEAYWREFNRCYAAGSLSNFPNTPLAITPAREGAIPLWGAGDSAAGLAHAGRIVDGYLTMLRGVDRIKTNFDAARASAANEGRRFADLGALASVVVRPKREEAEAHFYAIFQQTGVTAIVAKLEEAVKRRTKGQQSLATFKAPDAQRQAGSRRCSMAVCPSLKSYGLSGDSSPASPLGRRSIFSTRALPQSISSAIPRGLPITSRSIATRQSCRRLSSLAGH